MHMTPDQIKHMVDRFLCWKLPENFRPDCGIEFDADAAKKLDPRNHRYEPVGTNLFDAQQATAMVSHMLEGLPTDPAREVLEKCRATIQAQTDVGVLSTDPENEDPQHELTELLPDIDDALGRK
jgi:hypothetical protein